MFILILLFSLISFSFSLSNFNNNICFSYYKNSENEQKLIQNLKENSEYLISKERNTKKSNSCIALLLYTGNYNALEFYLNLLSKNGVQFRDTLNLYLSSLNSKFTHLESRYKFTENDYKKIVPEIKWAQSMDQIYMMIKFSAEKNQICNELNNLDYKFEKKRFYLKALCILKENPFEFVIDMKLSNEIVAKNSSFKLENFGVASVIMSKENNKTIWENLFENGQNFNVKIWNEMKEKHINELKENGFVDFDSKEFEEWKKKKEEEKKEEERKNKENLEYKRKLKEEKGKIHKHFHNDEDKSDLKENILNKITSDL